MKHKSRWKLFEKNLTSYLNRNYNHVGLRFVHRGSSNAYANDILVFKEDRYYFSLEAKYLPAQCGQITLKQKSAHFVFSKRSRQKNMPQTQVIIDLINNHELLQRNDVRFFEWIKAYYYQKNATWFGLSNAYENLDQKSIYVCRTKDLSRYVNVDATLRKKKSGSSRIPYRLIDKAMHLVQTKLPDALCHTEGLLFKKLYVQCEAKVKDPYLNEDLYLSHKGNFRYEVRKLSATKTLSVTFSMELKDNPDQSTPLI